MGFKKHLDRGAKQESHLTRGQQYGKPGKYRLGFSKSKGYHEVHHVLCDHAVSRRAEYYEGLSPTTIDYLEACLWITPWTINNYDNLIGLPLNRQYRESRGKRPTDLPSHQVDHNTIEGYTDEVSKYLRKNVWNQLRAKKKVHDVDVKKIKKLLEDGTTHFDDLLAKRGKRGIGIRGQTGTEAGWKNRNDPKCSHDWYNPFSMAAMANHRNPGKDPGNLDIVFELLG
jgi:hypothetical protein